MKKITQTSKIGIAFLSFFMCLTSLCYSQVLEVKGGGVLIPDNTSTTTNYIDFGTVPSGNKFSKSFVLKNTGSSSLVFSGAKVALSNSTDFSITTNVIVSANTLTTNTYLIIEISYNPTLTSGSQTSRVTITSNSTPAASATYTFNILGTASAAVTSDFTRTTLSPTFSYPYALIYGPDDYLWLTERGGKKINRINKTSGAVDLLLDMSALVYYGAITAQDGLLGMALHPNLGKGTGEDFVYVAYSYGTSVADEKLRIVRYTYTVSSNDGSLASPLVLMEGLSASNDHNSGKLAIGPDYKLYYTIGDQGVNQFINKCEVSHAQDIPTLAMLNSIPPNYNYYEGKTLRMNLDGSIPDDNPIINSIRSHIYTYGHRNAQGLVFGKNGKIYSSEHGPKSDDEINILKSGGNYGWPYISGYKDDKNYAFCNWSSASNCTSLTFSDYTCGVGATSLSESSWAGTFNPPISTLFTIDTGFNFTGGWLTWPTIGPSSAKIYEGFDNQIPGWENSILITTLKKGRIYKQKLSADGNSVVGAPEELFYTQNRYRDLAFDPDGKTIYIITDSGGTTSGPSGSSTLAVTDLGKILKFTYNPTLLTCTAPVPDASTLPTITNSCSVASITPPTATNNCAGAMGIVGITDTVFPITTQGTTTVIWKFKYGNGLTVTQNQTVTINSTTWNGTFWDNGLPSSSQAAIIAADYTVASDITACSLTINNNAIVTVNDEVNVTLNGALTVSSGSFTLNNNANLIQTTNVNNSGNIIVKRNSSALMRLDYSLWSSPVASQNLLSFSLLTTPNRFYNYNTSTNLFNVVANPLIDNFIDGQGYLIRMPNTHPSTPLVWNASFTGVPHNGYYPIAMINGGTTKRFNLVGNPYPSPIDMVKFVSDNNTKITGTLYFWRKTNGVGSAYCTWAGGTFVSNSNTQTVNPNGIIQTGQGFFVEALNASTSLQFNNDQRVSNTSGQFFKTKRLLSERSTLWLNASNTAGDFSQMAIAYIPNATQGLDEFDGKYYNDSTIALNSLIENEEFVIQGRSLPFDGKDVVPLLFKTLTASDYTISLDHYDGLFIGNQAIYLKDNYTATETNLKTGSYTFTAIAGNNANRFELMYKPSSLLETETLELSETKIIIYKQNKALYINAGETKMKSVKLYSMEGRLLFDQKNVNNTSMIIKDFGLPQQVFVVKIITIENKEITKKVVY